MEVLKSLGFSSTATKDAVVANSQIPVAAFSISPESPEVGQEITFDASASSDDDTDTDDLEVRWDFDGDGTVDTEWDTTKTAAHTYAVSGAVTVTLEVADVFGLVGVATKDINIGGSQPPTATLR